MAEKKSMFGFIALISLGGQLVFPPFAFASSLQMSTQWKQQITYYCTIILTLMSFCDTLLAPGRVESSEGRLLIVQISSLPTFHFSSLPTTDPISLSTPQEFQSQATLVLPYLNSHMGKSTSLFLLPFAFVKWGQLISCFEE